MTVLRGMLWVCVEGHVVGVQYSCSGRGATSAVSVACAVGVSGVAQQCFVLD